MFVHTFLQKNINKKISNAVLSSLKNKTLSFDECAFSVHTWPNFHQLINGKKLLLYGAYGAKNEFFKLYDNVFPVECVIDQCPDFDQIRILSKNIPVFDDTILLQYNPSECVILITSIANISNIYQKLSHMGFYNIASFADMEKERFLYRLLLSKYLFHRLLIRWKAPEGLYNNYIKFHIMAICRLLHIPFAYKPFKSIKQYKNIHYGKRCFIVATGPSLTINDVEKIENEITFSVNSIFRIFDKTSWRPTYYTLCDCWAYWDLIKQNGALNTDTFCQKTAFLVDRIKPDIINSQHYEKAQFVPFSYLDHACSNKKSRHFHYSKNLLWGSYNAWTVTIFAMNIAQYMGIKEIYLLGTDCSYIGKQYFDDRTNEEFKTNESAVQSQKNMIAGYTFIKKKFDKLGISVYNATRGGALEVFPRVNLDDLV